MCLVQFAHIQEERCPKLFGHTGNDVPANASDLGADLAPDQAVSPSSANLPYAQRPYEAMTRYGDNAAFHLPDRHVLTHRCALCHQWITEPGKVKQRYRLSHTRTYEQYLHPAANLCSGFNTPESPCSPKAPRQHPAKAHSPVASLCLTSCTLRDGYGPAGVLWRPTTEPWRISDDSSEGGTSRGPRQGDQGPRPTVHRHLCNSEGVDLRKEVPRIKT